MTNGTTSTTVVGIDGSTGSDNAVRWAERYAAATTSRLILMAVCHYPVPLTVGLASDYLSEGDARRAIFDAHHSLRLPARFVQTSIVWGLPAEELVRAANHSADLLVVGSRGRGALASNVLGSVSSYCVHHADVPVVVVRPLPTDRAGSGHAGASTELRTSPVKG